MSSNDQFDKFGAPYIEEIRNYLGKLIAWHVVWFEKRKGRRYPEIQARHFKDKAEAKAFFAKLKAEHECKTAK